MVADNVNYSLVYVDWTCFMIQNQFLIIFVKNENQELRINFTSSLIWLFFWFTFKKIRENRSKMAWREEVKSRKVLSLSKTFFDLFYVVVNFSFSCIRWLCNDMVPVYTRKTYEDLTVNDSKSQIPHVKAAANLQSGFRLWSVNIRGPNVL